MIQNFIPDREYTIKYFPPKNERLAKNMLLILVLVLVFLIGVFPIILISAYEYNEVTAFLYSAISVVVFFSVIYPYLLKLTGEELTIEINDKEIIFSDKENKQSYNVSETKFTAYENSGSDESDRAIITLIFIDGSEYIISRQFALEGDFEILLTELLKISKVKN